MSSSNFITTLICALYLCMRLGILFKIVLLVSLSFVEHAASISSEKNLTRIPIRIINELPKQNGVDLSLNDINFSYNDNNREKRKGYTVKPAPFTGPLHLQTLFGSCFSYLDEKYKFKFCPFHNITQEEIQTNQEPYKGILGIWGEWIIENNNFSAMHYIKGTKCGSRSERNVKIFLECGSVHRLVKIAEPAKCMYEGVFQSPLVCGENSLVVYPRLPKELQMEWDQLETEIYNGILTQKGYDEELHRIFSKAGYILSLESIKALDDQVLDGGSECDTITKSLKKRIKELEKEIQEKDSHILKLQKLMGQETS